MRISRSWKQELVEFSKRFRGAPFTSRYSGWASETRSAGPSERDEMLQSLLRDNEELAPLKRVCCDF
jgi:hypothetical protein